MTNWLGLFVSAIYIAVIVGIASFCYKKKKIKLEESRKFIHIGLCNWWLIAWIFFDNYIFASILPAIFIILNYLNYQFQIVPGIEEKKRGIGTVFYASALFILTATLFQNKDYLYIGAVAILALGYGDGIGGLITEYIGKHKFELKNKSVEGSLVCFIVTFLTTIVVLQTTYVGSMLVPYSIYIAVMATMLELFSPKNTDNLFMPLGTALYTYLVLNQNYMESFNIAFTVTSVIIFGVMATKALTPAGSFFALLLGTALYCLAGPYVFFALILFFVSSCLIEHYHKKKKKEKQRNIFQVIENGLPCLLFAIMYYFTKNEIAIIGCLTAIAGSTSDTWSSGIGYYSKERVKTLFSRKELPKGSSGGVTKLGLLGGLAGSLLIALFSLFLGLEHVGASFLLIFVFGFFTTLLDSIFGELFQVKYFDKVKEEFLETKPKGNKNVVKISGFSFLTNGVVNLVTVVISSLLSCLLAYFII